MSEIPPIDPGVDAMGRPVRAHWVHRTAHVSRFHECAPPTRDVMVRVPAAFSATGQDGELGKAGERADGEPGDLWRCGCGRLWQVIAHDMDAVPGIVSFGYEKWRPAGLVTRWRWRNR